MATDLCMALELDKDDLCGKVIAVLENNGGNANFVISALMSHCIETKTGIILLAMHNTFGHYHNVGIKLGGNLQKLKEEGSLKCIEMLKLMEASIKERSAEVDFLFSKNRKDVPLRSLFLMIKHHTETLLQTHKSVCIVIDDLSDLLCLGCNSFQVLSFFQYCRSMVTELKGCSLVVLCHTSKKDIESLKVAVGLIHTSYLTMEVCGFNTGLSGDVSGLLNVDKTDIANTRIRKTYHFKLEERRILVFSPGTSPAFV